MPGTAQTTLPLFLCLFACFLFPISQLSAQINYTTAQDGNWQDSTTWSPTGIPDFAGNDNVTIAHNVIVDTLGVHALLSTSELIIQPGASLRQVGDGATFGWWAGGIENHGYWECDCIMSFFRGDFINTGTFQAGFVYTDSVALYNDGYIEANGDFYSEVEFENNGTLIVYWFENRGHLFGNGTICATSNFSNSDSITGTLNICGQQNPPFTFWNTGYIDSTVQICAQGNPCETLLSSPEPVASAPITLFPNPGDGRFRLRIDALQATTATTRIFDATGRQLLAQDHPLHPGANELPLDLQMLATGIYFLHVWQGSHRQTLRVEVLR